MDAGGILGPNVYLWIGGVMLVAFLVPAVYGMLRPTRRNNQEEPGTHDTPSVTTKKT
jgi:hypothetical protein